MAHKTIALTTEPPDPPKHTTHENQGTGHETRDTKQKNQKKSKQNKKQKEKRQKEKGKSETSKKGCPPQLKKTSQKKDGFFLLEMGVEPKIDSS